jgi:hypothetical protein
VSLDFEDPALHVVPATCKAFSPIIRAGFEILVFIIYLRI